MGSDEEIPGYSELLGMQWLVNVARAALNKVYDHNPTSDSAAQERASLRELISLKDKLLQKKDAIVRCMADGAKLQNASKLLECYRDHIDILLSKHIGSVTKEESDSGNKNDKLSSILDEQRSIEGNSFMLQKGTPNKSSKVFSTIGDENIFDGNNLASEEKSSDNVGSSSKDSFGNYRDHMGRLKHSGAGDNPLWSVVRDVYPLSYSDITSIHDKIPL